MALQACVLGPWLSACDRQRSARSRQCTIASKSADATAATVEPKKGAHHLLISRQRFKLDRAMGQYTLHGWDEVTGASDDFVDNALLS